MLFTNEETKLTEKRLRFLEVLMNIKYTLPKSITLYGVRVTLFGACVAKF